MFSAVQQRMMSLSPLSFTRPVHPPTIYCLVSFFVRFSFYLTQWVCVGVDIFLCCLHSASFFYCFRLLGCFLKENSFVFCSQKNTAKRPCILQWAQIISGGLEGTVKNIRRERREKRWNITYNIRCFMYIGMVGGSEHCRSNFEITSKPHIYI